MKWAQQVATLAECGMALGCGHRQALSGSLIWCTECGAYADAKAIGLAKPCKGPPKFNSSYGGAWGQLRKLKRNIHPRTGERLPQPIDEQGKLIEHRLERTGIYANLAANRNQVGQPILATHVPVARTAAVATASDARQKMAERLARIRAKEAKARESLHANVDVCVVSQPLTDTDDGQPPHKIRRVEAEVSLADERDGEPPPAKVRRRCSYKQPG